MRMRKITFVGTSLVKPVAAWFLFAAGVTSETFIINIYS